jgi:hypothetical protein
MDNRIVVVSGLPRCGTSLMMQMLDRGGVPAITDAIRAADTDNPRGYYEFERVKKLKEDASWLPEARGKVVKMVSQLLYELPANEKYLVILMERDMDEMILSQEKMLERLGKPSAPRDQIRRAFTKHLQALREWLPKQGHIEVLDVSYNELLGRPEDEARRIAEFLGGGLDVEEMVRSVDPSLYRNRKGPDDRPGDGLVAEPGPGRETS